MIERHAEYKQPARAKHVLALWDQMVPKFRQGHAQGLQAHARSASRAQGKQG
jgi:glutamate synthase domain-containing protein 3